MKQLNLKWIDFVKLVVNGSGYFKNQKMKIVDLKYGESFVEIELDRKHLQGYGYVHGGVYSALIDSAGFFAVYTRVEGDDSAATIEMKINYLSSVKSGKLLAHAHVINLGKSIGLAEVTIKNEENKLLAHGTVTVMVKPPLKNLAAANLPAKFNESS